MPSGTIRVIFWALAGVVLYTYLLYPALLGVLAKLRPRPVRRGPFSGSVSVVVAAFNEEATIGRRVEELASFLAARPGGEGEVIVVSDGSTDATADVVRAAATRLPAVRLLALRQNAGKAAALSAGCADARGEVVAFADARQTWDRGALDLLLENFADPDVGAVSGDLVVCGEAGVMSGIGLYWRFEKWLRRRESIVHSMVGVTGAISAVRRPLFRPIPQGTVLDDVYWPMQVAMQRYRVIHDDRAHAFDRLPPRARDEFRRKVRTLSGNFQLASRAPSILNPLKDPIWFQLVSHKLLRLVVPWALLGMLAASAALSARPFYRAALVAQLAGYVLGVLGMSERVGARAKVASAAASFLVLNAAAWMAFWVWAFGRTERSWSKTSYVARPATGPAGATTSP